MPLRRDVPNEREDGRLRKRALLAVKLAASYCGRNGIAVYPRPGDLVT
jgi:hypothetical protein